MSQRYQFAITITLHAPFNTAASEPGRWGIDTPTWRDHRNRIALPGSLLHGRLREEIDNWATPLGDGPKPLLELHRRLGAPAQGAAHAPERKQLVFTDFVLEGERAHSPSASRTRIALGETGAVERGALQVIETVAECNDVLKFTGSAHAICADDRAANTLQQALQVGVGLIPQLGGDRSIGFGRVESITVGKPQAVVPEAIPKCGAATRAPRISFRLQFDRPWLISTPNPSHNLFAGSDQVPGNAIKAAFADTAAALGLSDALAGWFDDAVFGHAFCALGQERPRALPLSLATIDKTVVCLAAHADAVTLGTDGIAPTFAVDWKDDYDLRQHFGWAAPKRTLRVRTAIESTTRAAADNQLFAYECVLHEQRTGNQWQPLHWHSFIDLGRVPADRLAGATACIERVLGAGLVNLGKTKAGVSIHDATWSNLAAAQPAPALPANTVTLVLQTPALLTAPNALSPIATATDLHTAYAQTFTEISNGALELAHFYATQHLRGGHYQHKRFGSRSRDAVSTYAPQLLTDAGATFQLRVTDGREADAAARLDQWCRTGLPIPASWPEPWRQWQHNPYLPENGFGEIRVNQPEHSQWRPEARGAACQPVHAISLDPNH